MYRSFAAALALSVFAMPGLVQAQTMTNLLHPAPEGADITFQMTDDFRINLNMGWQSDGVNRVDDVYWGGGFEWNFVKPVTLIGEVFGLAGPSVDPIGTTEPRAQLGLRFTPEKNWDVDLIYGRNVGGENANWFTLGLNVRF